MIEILRRSRRWAAVIGSAIVITALTAPSVFAGNILSANSPDDPAEVEKDNIGIHAKDPELFEKAVEAGAKVVTVPGRDPFFVYWLPQDFGESEPGRVLVVMHGTDGNAYRHLLNFVEVAREYGIGVVSVQWGWERKPGKGYDYLDPEPVYRIMSLAVGHLGREHSLSRGGHAWLGFSRSATQCAIYAHIDRISEQSLFCYFIAASGATNERQPGMRSLLSGDAGERPIDGIHFYLWAGERDRGPTTLGGERADDMKQAKLLIERLGGVVDVLRIGPEGHGGFNHSEMYQEEAFDLWKEQMPSSARE